VFLILNYTAIRWRHGTGALFCLLALFGILALFQLPLELQPEGDAPEISIRQLAIYNGQGKRLQLADIAEVFETTGADTINHVDLERSVTGKNHQQSSSQTSPPVSTLQN